MHETRNWILSHYNQPDIEMTLTQKIAFRIQEIRKAKGLKQEQLAWDAGIDRSHLCQAERGKKILRIETLQKITNALNISMRQFFNSDIFIL